MLSVHLILKMGNILISPLTPPNKFCIIIQGESASGQVSTRSLTDYPKVLKLNTKYTLDIKERENQKRVRDASTSIGALPVLF